MLYENYYIIETVLTSPDPQVLEFDDQGKPVYAVETRSSEEMECVRQMQEGILAYADDFLEIIREVREEDVNKELDEAFLELIEKVKITDDSIWSITVEDRFFGRDTDIGDLM
ncbi:hypothetical protein [Butyrivibrio sp. WCE2006]|uniref:hypothetical protein n=1 Tax=Butyrivibrio sp. WCE2006 TaxID=1410611 RepID=UPI0005D153C1|nr:hypothetical protein [Butyrivibrio sp. WCE2006]